MIDDPVFAVETLTLGLEGERLHRVLWLRDKPYHRLRCDPELWLALGRGFALMVDGRTGRSGGAPTGEMRDPMALKPTGDQKLALFCRHRRTAAASPRSSQHHQRAQLATRSG